jgi:hypothetical protein
MTLKSILFGLSALTLASASVQANPCAGRCSGMRLQTTACKSPDTVIDACWGFACAYGIAQDSCFVDPPWESVSALGGCSTYNSFVQPPVSVYPFSDHPRWVSTPTSQLVQWGVDQNFGGRLGGWRTVGEARINPCFAYDCPDLYALLASTPAGGPDPDATTVVYSDVCPSGSNIDCSVMSECSRPGVVVTRAFMTFGLSGPQPLMAWWIKFSMPPGYFRLGAPAGGGALLRIGVVRLTQPNGTTWVVPKVRYEGNDGVWYGSTMGAIQSPAGVSFTTSETFSLSPTRSQIDFNQDGCFSAADISTLSAWISNPAAIPAGMAYDINGSQSLDSDDIVLWNAVLAEMEEQRLLFCQFPCSPCDIATTSGNGVPDGYVTESDYNVFFAGFFDADPVCDIANDDGTPRPPFGPIGVNNGTTEADYNLFYSRYFDGCP